MYGFEAADLPPVICIRKTFKEGKFTATVVNYIPMAVTMTILPRTYENVE